MSIFDDLLDIEEQFFTEGYALGIGEGFLKGKDEGFEFGFHQGYRLGNELGYYSGCVVGWSILLEKDPLFFKSKKSTAKMLQSLRKLLEDFSLDSSNEEWENHLVAIRAKFKSLKTIIGFDDTDYGYVENQQVEELNF